jgi:hypothetical protein
MGLWFNGLLEEEGLDLSKVRLLRHQDRQLSTRSLTPYRAWIENRAAFETYQRTQLKERQSYFRGCYWASFVGTPDGRTMFVGLYEVALVGPIKPGHVDPLSGRPLEASRYDLYDCRLTTGLRDYAGRLFIHWGEGSAHRAWVQRADSKSGNKRIVELQPGFQEPDFPGYAAFARPLSEIEALPATWASALRAARGVYLLTCPQTREQYVGAAYGEDGFLGRWTQYARDGHGGNVRLKSRNPSDYQASILEIASFATSEAEIIEMEARWKSKLQSREMGLNAN